MNSTVRQPAARPSPRTGCFTAARRILALGSLAAWTANANAPQIGLRLEVNRERIYLGETFVLAVRIDGQDDPGLSPDLAALANARTTSLGSQSRSEHHVRRIGGRTERHHRQARVHLFQVEPMAAGPFRAGPVRINAGGRILEAAGPDITVIGIEEQTWVQLDLQASAHQVLVDEPFTITMEIRIAALPVPHENVTPLPGADPPQLSAPFLDPEAPEGLESPELQPFLERYLHTDARAPGFLLNEYTVRHHPLHRPFAFDFDGLRDTARAKFAFPSERGAHNGQPVWRYRLERVFTPTREGVHVFGPPTFKGAVQTGMTGPGPPRLRDIFAAGPTRTVRVVPPPEKDRPASFVGVVAKDLAVTADIDPRVCTQGDPLRLTLEITGDFNAANLRPPRPLLRGEAAARFRVQEDGVTTEPLADGKRFVYRLRPLNPGTQEFPPVEVAYFSTRRRAYRVLTTESLPLQVRPATEWILDSHDDALPHPADDAFPSGDDALPCGIMRYAADPLFAKGMPAVPRRAWSLGPALGLLALLGVVISKQQPRLHRRIRRRRSARRLFRLLEHRDQAPSSRPDPGPFRTEVQRYLAESWNLAPGRMTPSEAPPALRERGMHAALADEWGECLRRLDTLDYAAGTSHPNGTELAAALADLARRTETRPPR